MPDEIIKREIKRKGGVKAVADALEVSTAAVYYWINGQRSASDKLLTYLGLERKERIVRAKEGGA